MYRRSLPVASALYVDGACYPHVIPSLARAGWAGVFFARGKITAAASAPVWHPAIQSSGVAEWTPLCGITQLLRQPTPVYTDYANLVSAAAAPRRAATIGALRHGGLQRFFEHHPNRRLVTDVFKVRAHVDIHTVANDESPLRHAIGNAAADAAARHPPWDPDALRRLARDIDYAVTTLRVAAHVLPLWRYAMPFGFQRKPITRAVLPLAQCVPRPPVGHMWQASLAPTTWQCQTWSSVSRRGPAHRTRWHSNCSGFNSAFRTMLAQAQGRTLVVGSCGILPIA